jgi:hypothetical protein
LDAFKLKLKYFNEDLEKLLNLGTCLDLVDNGNFLKGLLRDKQNLINTAKRARLEESNQDLEIAFETWVQASLLIDEITEKMVNSRENIDLAAIKVKK